jgi:hypothetical protein
MLFVGAGNPKPLSFHRATTGTSSDNSPSRIIPQRGKISEYDVKPPRSEHWAVLHEYVFGLYLANDPGKLGPQSRSLPVDIASFTGGRYVLTGESSTYHINLASPVSSVKRFNVIPDGEPGQDSVTLPLQEHFPTVRFNFDSTDTGMPEKDSTEDTSPCSSKKV